jgi:hypothetical protein
MALSGEIVDLDRPYLLHQPDQVGGVAQIAAMHQKRHVAGVAVLVEMVDADGIE